MKFNVGIVGCGSLGAALAGLIAKNGHQVNICDSDPTKLKKLPSHKNIIPQNSVDNCLQNIDYLIPALPSDNIAKFYQENLSKLNRRTTIIGVTKGFFSNSTSTISQALHDKYRFKRYYILSGPTFALEIIAELPTSCVIAGPSQKQVPNLEKLFKNRHFTFDYSTDMVGTEIGGIIKNCYAITLGLLSRDNYQMNTKSLALTKIVQETAELYRTLKLNPKTVISLAFLGDLIATSLNPLSRNHQYGLGRLSQNNTVEGANNLDLILKYARQNQLKLPILETTRKILTDKTKKEALTELLLQ